MKIEKIELINDGRLPHPHDVYWNINLPELRLTISVFKKKTATKEKAEKLIEYLKQSLSNYKED